MKPFFKFIIIVSIIPLLIGLYFFDNIKGYYRFKQYCEKEGGLRVYEPLEKNVGWIAADKHEARVAALLDYVGFVRYVDHDNGLLYDIRYLGGDPQKEASFEVKSSDIERVVVYEWKSLNIKLLNELRLEKGGYEVLSLEKKIVVSGFYMFFYSKFDRRKTILDAPSKVGCFDKYGRNFRELSLWEVELNSAFEK